MIWAWRIIRVVACFTVACWCASDVAFGSTPATIYWGIALHFLGYVGVFMLIWRAKPYQ